MTGNWPPFLKVQHYVHLRESVFHPQFQLLLGHRTPHACQSCHIQAREQTGCDEKKDYPSATLIVDARCLLYGSAVLLSVEDALVKVQLVSGNAEFNLLTNDDLYIDELDLGTISWPNNNQNRFQPPANMVNYYGSVDDIEAVWLPVFYQEAKWENLQNDAIYESARTILPFAPIMAVDVYNHTF